MESIKKIYENTIGISFFWRDRDTFEEIQLIFRDIGFYLNTKEIEVFRKLLQSAKQEQQQKCDHCRGEKLCRSILLHTPFKKIGMAVSIVELNQIEDLLNGTLFQLRLKNYLNNLCRN